MFVKIQKPRSTGRLNAVVSVRVSHPSPPTLPHSPWSGGWDTPVPMLPLGRAVGPAREPRAVRPEATLWPAPAQSVTTGGDLQAAWGQLQCPQRPQAASATKNVWETAAKPRDTSSGGAPSLLTGEGRAVLPAVHASSAAIPQHAAPE